MFYREAVVDCPQQENEVDILTTEEKEKIIKTKQANIRDLIGKIDRYLYVINFLCEYKNSYISFKFKIAI